MSQETFELCDTYLHRTY